ncbi:MAG: hypothetical protein NZ571_04430, partial [Anaerolineae bacterium]|nr:hypothetical protein [Anaerolineae bacterium]
MSAVWQRWRDLLSAVLHSSLLLTAFLGAWWLRPSYPEGLRPPPEPYFLGFLVTVPVGTALLCWLLIGLRGLGAVLRDARRWWLLWWLLLTAWASLSPTWALYKDASGNSALQFLAVTAVGVVALCTPLSTRALIGALAAGALVQSVVVIAQVVVQDDLGLRWLGELNLYAGRQGLSVLRAADLRLLRPYGLSVHPNVVGGYLAVSLLAMSAWLFSASATWRTAIRTLSFSLALCALCLTFSRSAWLAYAVMTVGLLVWAVRSKQCNRAVLRRLKWIGALSCLIIGGF